MMTIINRPPSREFHAHQPEIAQRIARAARLLILLDYDGTLCHLVDRPQDAHLSSRTRNVLEVLGSCSNVSIGIVSGRRLSDVRERVSLPGVVYAGNHGLELSAGGIDLIEPTAASNGEALNVLCRSMQAMLLRVPNAWVENKGLSASVHFRLVASEHIEDVRQIVVAATAPLGDLFWVNTGHMVFEIRPVAKWNKGTAAQWIRNQDGYSADLAIYLGDDESDEDAFLALRDDITIRVGAPLGTFANYHLPGPDDVLACLSWIARVRVKSAQQTEEACC